MGEDNRNLFGDEPEPVTRRVPQPKSNIVPFGKYKGQPIEAMAADAGYMEWLAGQTWFRDKYENIYTLIINNFTEPSETPAHNALQVLFLDNEFAMRIVEYVESKKKFVVIDRRVVDVWFERGAVDVTIYVEFHYMEDDMGDVLTDGRWQKAPPKEMSARCHYLVELKPSVGDDYPAVLRQMGNLRKTEYGACRGVVLFLEQYIGAGATREQFVETFRRSGIVVVFRSEIDGQP